MAVRHDVLHGVVHHDEVVGRRGEGEGEVRDVALEELRRAPQGLVARRDPPGDELDLKVLQATSQTKIGFTARAPRIG